jgi:2-polyprenyl-6-methoxyphenol hydroxylase-like FAD-dependent oxidoreductase
MHANERRTALIAGGGIAGLASAIALRHVGVEPVVFEAHSKGSGGTSSFLTVATNGVDALRAIGAGEQVLQRSFPTPEIVLRSATGKRLGSTPTGVPLADGTQSQTLKREALHAAMADAAAATGVAVEYGKRLVDARPDGERVRAFFADGTEASGEMLIGADGVHSAVRRIVDPAAPTERYERLLTTGGYVTGVELAAHVGSYEMIFGRQAFFGYVPAPNGETWWFANLPRPLEPSPDEQLATDQATLRALLLSAFAADAGPAVPLIEATAELQRLAPVHTVPRLRRWRRGPIVLIGDAAHAPSPTSGQGASLSIEDAVALAWAVRRNDATAAAFADFEAERRQRVERIVKWASRMNNTKAAGPIGRSLRDALMPIAMRLMAGSKTMRLPFDHHAQPLI